MGDFAAWTLLGLSTFGIATLLVQLIFVRLHVQSQAKETSPGAPPAAISILKPLCGVDDDLEANLECFATLEGAPFELLLGVKD